METLGVWSFIGVVVAVGAAIGTWLQWQLQKTNQNIRLPSAVDSEGD